MRLDILFLRVAALYLVIGMFFGVYMGASDDFTLHSVHAHMGVLGWVSFAIFGLFYKLFPEIQKRMLSNAHFWVAMIAYPAMFISLGAFLYGKEWAEPVLGVTSAAVAAAGALFAVIVFSATSRKG